MTHTMGKAAAKSHRGISIMQKLLLVCAVLIVALPANAAGRYGWGGYAYGPAFGPWGYYGYSPFFYGYGVYPYGHGVGMHPNAGLVKLDTKVKDAEVFVDGAFAGTARDLKSMWLRPGMYNLEIRSLHGEQKYVEQIYVVSGKTLHVRPDLREEPNS